MQYYLLFIAIVFAAIIVRIVLGRILAIKRTKALRNLAARSGFDFQATARKPGVGEFALFRTGHGGHYRNFLKG